MCNKFFIEFGSHPILDIDFVLLVNGRPLDSPKYCTDSPNGYPSCKIHTHVENILIVLVRSM